jgi:nitric oxide reductase NorD protein
VEETLAAQRGAVTLLRRYFESLRPPGLRRVPGQLDGEDLDMDAVIGRVADLSAGIEPSERIYVRREKREREVAVAFLVDLSDQPVVRSSRDGGLSTSKSRGSCSCAKR